MKKWTLLLAALLALCMAGCNEAQRPETTAPTVPTQTTAPAETTVPTETTVPPETTEPTVPVELTIPWTFEYANLNLYSYEDYFAFEQNFRAESGFAHSDIYAVGAVDGEKGLNFLPYVEDGKLFLQNREEAFCFQVGDLEYADLTVIGTDGYQWIYCLEDSTTLFRIDPLGNQENLYTAEYGIIDGSYERFFLSDWHNVAFFVAGTEEGWGIYRIHLPSKRVDLLCSCEEYITYFWAGTNYRVSYKKEGDDDTYYSTPGPERDPMDTRIQYFQWLLEPNTYGNQNGANNWYNNVAGCIFDSPRNAPVSALTENGFRDLPTKLTEWELAVLGDAADADTHYWKLPGARIDQLLRTMFGVTRTDLERDAFMESQGVLYDPASDTYYRPCTMRYPENEVYVRKTPVRVDKVEETEDGLVKVWYMPEIPQPFGSDRQDDELLMTLKLVDGAYQIVSVVYALTPLGTAE